MSHNDGKGSKLGNSHQSRNQSQNIAESDSTLIRFTVKNADDSVKIGSDTSNGVSNQYSQMGHHIPNSEKNHTKMGKPPSKRNRAITNSFPKEND